MKKSLIAIMMTIVILLSLMAPLLSTVQAVDPSTYYTTVDGVLDTDYYILYPYAAKSLNVGFSKFGELIGIPAGADQTVQANWVGLEYGTRDPFCPATVIPMTSWINGWFADIEYTDPALSGVLRDRHLWAFAMFSDGFGWGGDWTWAATPGSNPGYGRQTNGYCTTDPLEILYDGPREFIAQSMTHIYDKQGATTWPVVDVAITLVFNKVKKEVILYKDIKLKIPKMHLWGKLDVEFSNREEYDLGPDPSYDSYAHFYEQAGVTSYGPDWHMAKTLLRANVEHLVGTGQTVFTLSPPGGAALARDFMKVWINGVFQDPSTYTINWVAKTITFSSPVGSVLFPADIEVHYKFEYKDAVVWNQEYDIAQVLSSDGLYVAWTGMWPPVSDFTVDGILRYLTPLTMVNEADCSTEPKQSPLIIGEWDFLMDHASIPQFRCVEVKGVTDRHDAQDSDHADGNVIDREVRYQLDEVFQPWDLYDAVEKQTERWVAWPNKGPGGSTTFTTAGFLPTRPVVVVPTALWDQYCTFSERLIDLTTGKLLNRWLGQYGIVLNADGTATITGLNPTHDYKLLYSTKYMQAKIVVLIGDAPAHSAPSGLTIFGATAAYGGDPGRDATMFTPDDLDYAKVVANLAQAGITVLGVNYNYGVTDPDANFNYMTANTGGVHYDGTTAWDVSVAAWVASAIGAFGGADVAFVVDLSGSMPASLVDAQTKIGNIVNSLALLDVYFGVGSFVDYPAAYTSYGYSATYGTTATGDYAWKIDQDLTEDGVLVQTVVNALTTYYGGDGPQDYTRAMYESMFFDWRRLGRYEWIEVGRDSQPIDSAGAALVSEAFDSYKDIDIGISGLDMLNDVVVLQGPMIMSKFGAGTEARSNYIDTIGRAALKDDWCTYWPIASSNIIGVGGPYANLLAYYTNDFTTAFYGLPPYAGTTYSDKITGIPCWNRGWTGPWNVYSSDDSLTLGYAVIATYKDINGTVFFMVWGHKGRDTYYASQWLHGDEARNVWDPYIWMYPGIEELQRAPGGLTSIILKIDYTDPKHPQFSIVECLGTISETDWRDPLYWRDVLPNDPWIKGGIHDP